MFETLQTRQPLICFHVYGIMAYRVQHTRWSVQRNSMAVQMLNLGILEFWNLWVLESLDCGIVTRDLESSGLGTITGIPTGILESWDYGSLAGVFAVFATTSLLEICYGWSCKLGGLPPGEGSAYVAYRVQHTGWFARSNSMAVQMPNLGISESWNLEILESLSLEIFGLWDGY